jgi:hypothetical protein
MASHSNVYDKKQQGYRVTFVCAHILRAAKEGRFIDTSRTFDSCFEMGDGDAVAARVYHRALGNPRLMQWLPKYLAVDTARNAYAREFGGEWTDQDRQNAARQGWNLFVDEDCKNRIQRIDDPCNVAADYGLVTEEQLEELAERHAGLSDKRFARILGTQLLSSDAAALRLVKKNAAKGDETCIRALKQHGRYDLDVLEAAQKRAAA